MSYPQLERIIKKNKGDENVINKLRQAREEAGYTIKDVHRITGLSETTISDTERGKRAPSIKTCLVFETLYRKPLSYLFSLDEEELKYFGLTKWEDTSISKKIGMCTEEIQRYKKGLKRVLAQVKEIQEENDIFIKEIKEVLGLLGDGE